MTGLTHADASPSGDGPAAYGFRMPAEWHPHASTWLAWPKDPETWPDDRLPLVQAIFLRMIELLAPHERVDLLVDDEETAARVRTACPWPQAVNLHIHVVLTADAWIRDYGPNFLLGPGGLAYNHWGFNAWGDKYPALKADAHVPDALGRITGARGFTPGLVLEGGSIDVNGAGVVMTTEQCLLNRNRNPDLDRAAIERRLRGFVGVTDVLWLGEGIAGDDTDGHVDDVARFVSPDTIVCAAEPDPADVNHAALADNVRRLELARDPAGRRYHVVRLPMPGVVGPPADRLPASYANFYIANRVVLLPVFGHPVNDRRAVEILQPLFPDREVVLMPCEPLVWGLGAIHCVTQQQPAV